MPAGELAMLAGLGRGPSLVFDPVRGFHRFRHGETPWVSIRVSSAARMTARIDVPPTGAGTQCPSGVLRAEDRAGGSLSHGGGTRLAAFDFRPRSRLESPRRLTIPGTRRQPQRAQKHE